MVDTEGSQTAQNESPKASPKIEKQSASSQTPQPLSPEKEKIVEASKNQQIEKRISQKGTESPARQGKEEFLQELRNGGDGEKEEKRLSSSIAKDLQGVQEREVRKRMPKIRRVIADRLLESSQTTAKLTTFNEVEMSAILELREKYKEVFIKQHGVKLGFMSFFV